MKPITVKQLIKELQQYPEDLPCIYSSDEEGNNYNYVYFIPAEGFFDERNSQFYSKKDGEEANDYIDARKLREKFTNCVCIN